jgi:hypothetical protein
MTASGHMSWDDEQSQRFNARSLLRRHNIFSARGGPTTDQEIDTTPDLMHTIEVPLHQPLYTEQTDLNAEVLRHYREHGPSVPYPPTWQRDHDDSEDAPHRPTIVTIRGRHWLDDGHHRVIVSRERREPSFTAWHVDPERDRREYEAWARGQHRALLDHFR